MSCIATRCSPLDTRTTALQTTIDILFCLIPGLRQEVLSVSVSGVRVETESTGIDAHMQRVSHRSRTGGVPSSAHMVLVSVKQRACAADERVRLGHQDGRGLFFACSAILFRRICKRAERTNRQEQRTENRGVMLSFTRGNNEEGEGGGSGRASWPSGWMCIMPTGRP